MSDARHREVARGYDEIGSRYADASRDLRTADSYYRSFMDRCLGMLESGSFVLDLGCGPGLVARELAERVRVLGVDLSFQQLRSARSRAPGVTFVLADMATLELRDGSLDAVAAFWSIIHVRRDLHAALFDRIHSWLRHGGLLFGTLGAQDNPDEHGGEFFGTSMTWNHFDAETNRRLLRGAGFALEHAEVVDDMGERHLWVIARA
jgi:SAM-dependent methyltransferase